MKKSELPRKIYKLQSFQQQLEKITINSVSSNFLKLKRARSEQDLVSEVDWNNLLSCSSILAQSDDFENLDAALRVAQSALDSSITEPQQKIAAAIILEKLTNKPAIQLAIERKYLDINFRDDIPLPLLFDISNIKITHSIVSEGNIIDLNRFQKKVFDEYKVSESVSISAPTSAGKSFILSRIVIEETKKEQKRNIIYLVPTRALISQVENDFRQILKSNKELSIYLSTIPQPPTEEFSDQSALFIFTQERLHWFLSENPNFPIDVAIVDEAQKINDGYRGILLQQKIEELIDTYPNLKIYFSCPFTSNPEILHDYLPQKKIKSVVKTDFVSVNQNLIYVSQKERKPLEWQVDLCIKDKIYPLGELLFQNRPAPESKRLIFIVCEMADTTGGNLIYANGPADAEKIAMQIATTLFDQPKASEEVNELIELIEKTIHKEYSLIAVLKRGIAFHYGNMPLIVREEIERLFKKGHIRYLVCTSTLLEGVNLPAKSIFLSNPYRGQNNPLTNADFWNLAGRAGRWGQEFQGNVICIEPEKWRTQPDKNKSKLKIKESIVEISINQKDLVKFIENDTPRSTAIRNPSFEYALTYYYSKYLNENSEKAFIKSGLLKPTLEKEFIRYKELINIPNKVILRNPGISPLAQQNLLNYFQSYEGIPEDLVPDLPESKDAIDKSYKNIVSLISQYLSGDSEKTTFHHAILVVQWMQGYPLARLIQSSYSWWKKQPKPKKIATVIRDTMAEVEEFVKFKFAKYSSCYIDILRLYFQELGRLDLIEKIPQLNIWLEFGVSQQTQISLINLGLSRSTAITLSEYIPSDRLTTLNCREWLIENDYGKFDLNEIQIKEIDVLIDKETLLPLKEEISSDPT